MLAALAALALLTGGAASAEHAIDLRGAFGYDTNPFELNEIVGKREGPFADLEAQVSAVGLTTKGSRKRADIGASGRLYESGMTDADEGSLYVRARGDSNEKPTEHGWEWSLRYRVHDQTYVSRFTGLEATDDLGNEIGDRYDNGTGDFQAAWHFPRKAFGRISVEGSIARKDYVEDYEEFGLDRLDYYEYG
ncbi:MAG: hypothetical protein ACREEP_16645, partial [Dongiaceae bacterium]